MNNPVEVKDKLFTIIKEMILSDPEIKIPSALEEFILESQGWTVSNKHQTNDDLNEFVKTLQKWIENLNVTGKNYNSPVHEIQYELNNSIEKYLEMESEYVRVTAELVQVLSDMVKYKEDYSEEFKNKCKFQKISMDVLRHKLQFLEMQFFFKLYKEDNALSAHLKLQQALKKKLENSKKCYNDIIKRNEQYDQIKTDKNFIELFKIYEALKKAEKRSEIIAQM